MDSICCSITKLPSRLGKNITLENIYITFQGGGTQEHAHREIQELPEDYPHYERFSMLPAYEFFCRHIENLTFDDVELDSYESYARRVILCDDITGLELYMIKARVISNELLMKFKDMKNASVQSCIAPKRIDTFLHLSGS